jgi:hypothetical protein
MRSKPNFSGGAQGRNRTTDTAIFNHVTVNATGSNGIVLAAHECLFYCDFVPLCSVMLRCIR